MAIYRKLTLTLSLLLLFTALLPAQQALYQPRDFQQSVKKGTRSLNGQPGPRYWQNRASYQIDARALPSKRRIEGGAKIIYTNNSPDTLPRLNIKLIQNVHLPQANRASYTGASFLTTGIIITRVQVEGQNIGWDNNLIQKAADPTNAWIILPEPLLPGASLELELDWNYQLQTSSLEHREGMVDKTSLFAGYWYPRIAVYDDVHGWDRLPHNVQTEFYGDFNDYDVTIRVPKGYVVWATGTLENVEEVLSPLALERFLLSQAVDTVVHIITKEMLADGQAVQPLPELAWHFRANEIIDFSFGMSDHFLWDATSLPVEEGRRVSVQAAYQPNSKDFHEVAAIARGCIDYFSSEIPGIPYPYPTMTIFNGHGQMEFPMMVNDQDMSTLDDTKALTAHEIAHTYFPFLTGINESRYAWMDEGWATLLEFFACTEKFPLGNPEASIYPGYYLSSFLEGKGLEVEVPLLVPSHQLLGTAYSLNSYGKPAAAYLSLYHLLLEDPFLDCIHEFVKRWRGKHPLPHDFFHTVSDCYGQDLNWFWKRWFMEFNTMNLALISYRQKEESLWVTVRNEGGLPLPVPLKLNMEDGSSRFFKFSTIVWQEKDEIELEVPLYGKVKSISLEWKEFRDVDPRDDRLEIK